MIEPLLFLIYLVVFLADKPGYIGIRCFLFSLAEQYRGQARKVADQQILPYCDKNQPSHLCVSGTHRTAPPSSFTHIQVFSLAS